ncbi:MAG: recombinase family protein [Bacteroidetes bacterium]|nr:MAG: recombinase family protein [Bacteroidota bacterium]
MKDKKVGIWIRVSTEFQVKDDSPEHHEKRARSYAEAKGWNIVELYKLDGVSGKSVMDHPEAKRMLKDVRAGRITGLIFSKLARLARNTKELLEFSEIFRAYDADLISLSESIDTSSSAGRLFYTMIAALSEWERSEIAERVAASVPIRAKLGKSLGGAAPFGYRWEGKNLFIEEKEAQVRKIIYELFIEHKRKATVADILNRKGYRTRNGSEFSDTTIGRLLRDPVAKGLRRANYTKSLGENKKWEMKPKEDWVMITCPAIIDEATWDSCNAILDSQEVKRNQPTRKSAHLFSGILLCSCGGKMYVPTRVTKYMCSRCKKTNIMIDDIESIYYENLKSFILGKDDIAILNARSKNEIDSKNQELVVLGIEKNNIRQEMDKLVLLHNKDQLPTERFGEYYTPLNLRLKQCEDSILDIESQLDYIKHQQLNGEYILENADSLYKSWPKLSIESRRKVVEELTESIIISNDEIYIKFHFTPNSY